MRRSDKLLTAALCGLTFCWASAVRADAPASEPATQAAAVEPLKVDVVAVKGLVQVRIGPDAPWAAAKEGMEVDEGAEFRTGPHSSVTCQIPPDQTLTLDRLGTVKIAEAIRSGSKLKTDLVMKYGRTHYDIEAAGIEHESTIRSPSSTLAVRGTSVSLYDQPPFTPEAVSYHGTATFRNAHRTMRFGAKSFTQVANDKSSAADTALAQQTVDPQFSLARTDAETRHIMDQSSSSATIFFDRQTMIETIVDGPPPPSDAQLTADAADGKLPGNLDIVIRWTGNADLNLNVTELNGTDPIKLLTQSQTTESEYLYPGFGLNHSNSGGTIPYDNRGGPNGGMELAYWQTPPKGLYGFSAVHQSGGPATVSFNVFLDGKPLDNLTAFEVDSSGNVVLDSNGLPSFVVKNSQITRPVTAPTNPLPPFGLGAGSGLAAVQEFIPSIPSQDDQVPVETPVTFPGFPAPVPATGDATAASAARTSSAAGKRPTPPDRVERTALTPMQTELRPQPPSVPTRR